jgi:hypothetical protein
LGRNDSLQFFQRSGLQQWVLANIWKQVNPQDAPNLGPTQFVLGRSSLSFCFSFFSFFLFSLAMRSS